MSAHVCNIWGRWSSCAVDAKQPCVHCSTCMADVHTDRCMTCLFHLSADGRSFTVVAAAWIGELESVQGPPPRTWFPVSEQWRNRCSNWEILAPLQQFIKCMVFRAPALKSMTRLNTDVKQLSESTLRKKNSLNVLSLWPTPVNWNGSRSLCRQW